MNKKLFIILAIAYRLLLDEIYMREISPFFDYAKLVDEKTAISAMISWGVFSLITFFVIPFIDEKKDEFVSSVAVMLYILRVVSFTSFIQFSPQEPLFISLNVIFWISLFVLLNSSIFDRRTGSIRKSESVTYISAIVSIITVLIVSGVYARFRIHLTFEDVYDLREEARSFNVPTLLAYLYSATGNVIPILIVYFILTKKKSMVVLLIIAGILNFGVAGQKATIMKILACVAMIYYVKVDLRKVILPVIIILCLIIFGEYLLFKEPILAWMITRRMFYVPNMIDTLYYDYIHANGPLYFDTKASGDLAFKLSDIYLNRESNRSNNGLFSDAYTNLGAIGMLIFPLILSFVIKKFSQVLEGQNKSIIVFSAFIISTTLHSAFLTRCLMTHGLLLLFVVLYYMPNKFKREF